MFLEPLDLTTALRPLLLQDETLLFVQNGVGLYQGFAFSSQSAMTNADVRRKYKIPDLQDGQVYLTTHRLCYVDSADPRKKSVALGLKNLDRYEFYV